jgi:hypothetical protein
MQYNPLITLKYSPKYEDIVPYLSELLEEAGPILTLNPPQLLSKSR